MACRVPGEMTGMGAGARTTSGFREMIKTVLVLNSKGGCGKSTIATNLAAYYAATGVRCQLLDYDPQGSSLQWLAARPADRPAIQGIDATRTRSGLTRTWQMFVPPDVGRVVIDAPAGVGGIALQEMLRRADVVLVPLTGSVIDVHATRVFLTELLHSGLVRRNGLHLGVVANRFRRSSQHFEAFQRFLESQHIPLVATLSDSENYLIAAEAGLGVYELDERETSAEREQWYPLLRWLIDPTQEVKRSEPLRPRLNVIGAG
jgi:chromosome partitioning protein